MQIALTAFVTILVGALTLVVGQIIVRGAIEPALDLKRLIGTIAHDLDFYANRFHPGHGWVLTLTSMMSLPYTAGLRTFSISLNPVLSTILPLSSTSTQRPPP